MAKTPAQLIELIDTEIETLITSPQVDYQIGEKRVSAGQKITQLREMREALLKQQTQYPAGGSGGDFTVVAFDSQINEFGTDRTQRG